MLISFSRCSVALMDASQSVEHSSGPRRDFFTLSIEVCIFNVNVVCLMPRAMA